MGAQGDNYVGHWGLDDVDWRGFQADKVDADLLAIVKTAAIVEANAADYVTYLEGVFEGDAAFCAAARQWGAEERQHGAALARWARLADPQFDFDLALATFRGCFHIPPGDGGSIRGSRAGELVARQVVETGTSSFYSAIRDAAREPVLAEIAGRIAADEFRHYKLFADHARRYPPLGRAEAAKVAVGRFAEASDEELGWAWYAAVLAARQPSTTPDPRAYARRYNALVARLYRRRHVESGVRMLLRAVGLRPRGPLFGAGSLVIRGLMKARALAA